MQFIKLNLIPDKKTRKRENTEILVNIDHIATIYPCPTMPKYAEICINGGLDDPYIIVNHSYEELTNLLEDAILN